MELATGRIHLVPAFGTSESELCHCHLEMQLCRHGRGSGAIALTSSTASTPPEMVRCPPCVCLCLWLPLLRSRPRRQFAARLAPSTLVNTDNDLELEIWALGLRNPWRCSFDSKRPSYFNYADIGQDQYEEVDLISKVGNYGWRVYEGPLVYHPPWTHRGNTPLSSINSIPHIMGYGHYDVNKNIGSASIMGGFLSRVSLLVWKVLVC